MTADPQRPDRMPVLVLSGFLGAGKTTFLNRLLATEPLKDTLVIVNEFGDAGLDSLFLQEADEARGDAGERGLMIEELTSGCLCCTLQGPLVQTLEDLLRARDNGRIAPFKQLVIETTGLADPAPILAAFARHPYLSLRYLVGGIVTVVDAAQDPEGLDASPEAVAQVAVADVLALSKTDLATEDESAQRKIDLSTRNPHASIRTVDELAGETAWLESLLAQAFTTDPSTGPALQSEGHRHHGHDHGHAHDQHHDHGHHHHDHDHQHAYSVVLATDQSVEQRTITMLMDLLGMNFPGDLLRVKGVVWIAGDESAGEENATPWAVHSAGPLQHPPRPIAANIASKLKPGHSEIVVITRTDQTAKVEGLFEACLNQNRAG